MLPIRQRHSNELVVIVKDERGKSKGGRGAELAIRCGIAFALRFIGLPDRHALRFLSSSWLVVPIFSGHCQSNHI